MAKSYIKHSFGIDAAQYVLDNDIFDYHIEKLGRLMLKTF